MKTLFSAFFVVWRETFEALLIIFMIWTGFSRQGLWSKVRPFVAGGVGVGMVLSGVFAWAILFFSESAEGVWAQTLQAGFPLLAALFMLHMVYWMSAHSREISGEIRALSQTKESRTLAWGVFALVAYALTREGFETVVYLYGLSLNPINKHLNLLHYAGLLIAGTGASALCLVALKRGLGFFKLKTFFRLTNFFLLGTAASLLTVGVNKLIEFEYLPSLVDPVWNTSNFVSSEGWLGQGLNLFLGYTPVPSLMLVIWYFGFWTAATFLLLQQTSARRPAEVLNVHSSPSATQVG
jgi:high-affinity iron transporter